MLCSRSSFNYVNYVRELPSLLLAVHKRNHPYGIPNEATLQQRRNPQGPGPGPGPQTVGHRQWDLLPAPSDWSPGCGVLPTCLTRHMFNKFSHLEISPHNTGRLEAVLYESLAVMKKFAGRCFFLS